MTKGLMVGAALGLTRDGSEFLQQVLEYVEAL